MKYVLIDNYKSTPLVHREHGDLSNIIRITYLDGPKVEVSGEVDESYEVNFINDNTGDVIYSSTIKPGMWSAASIRYFVNWRIQIKRDGIVVKEDILNLKGKRVKIIYDTQSMGDLIAYIGATDAFQRKRECQLDCVVFSKPMSEILKNTYPNINFLATDDDNGIIYHAIYRIGWFNEWVGRANHNPQSISLAHIASDILGFGLTEFKPRFSFNREKKHSDKKYVCISIQSTAQYKYWNYVGGWEKVIEYLKSLGYEVWCIDRDRSFGSRGIMNVIPKGAVDKTGNMSLMTRMEQINGSEFLIGISSGLSWLAWAIGTPVILISGMSEEWEEFSNPHRIINKTVCHGCCNDTAHRFDKTNWLFCPRGKNFECSKSITPEMVINEIKSVINGKEEALQKKFDFDSFFEKYRTGIVESGNSRHKFYNYIIPKLVAKGKPLYILETGTMWASFKDNMGAFTLVMADLIKNYTGGKLYTVDISEKNLNACKEHTKEFAGAIEYVLSDSVAYLRSLNKELVNSLDLIYLDSYDLYVPKPHESSQHHLDELTALYPNLSKECGIAIDDNFLPNTFIMWNWYNSDGSIKSKERFETGSEIIGKGKYCNKYLLDRGWTRFSEFEIGGGSNLFYYENGKCTVEQVKDILEKFYNKNDCVKPSTEKFLIHSKVTNWASGLGDAIIMTNICEEKGIYNKFPQFKELVKYSNCIPTEPEGCFDIDTSDLTKYNWGGGHCTQRLEMAFLGRCSLVPKPAIFKKRSVTKKKVGLHLSTSTKNKSTNNLPDATAVSILEFLNNNGYVVVDCAKIADINILIEELSTCEYFVGIDSGPMHVAAALEIKSVVILNRDDSDQIYLPKLKDVDIPNSEWLYPQNVHLSMKNKNELIEKFSIAKLKDALGERLYPYFSTMYIKEIQNVLASWRFDASENKLTFKLNRKINNGVLALKELTTNLKCFHWDSDVFDANVEYYIVPTTTGKLMDTDFSGFVFDLYENGKHIYSKELVVRNVPPAICKFYSDKTSDLKLRDHFYIQHMDFYNNPLLDTLVKEGDVVVDVGASCGTFAYNCLGKKVKRIVCLEPSPSFSILSKTFDAKVECIDAALSIADGYKDFYFTDQSTLNTFNIDDQKKYDSGNYIKSYEKKSVKCITLDSLIKRIFPDTINLLKIDIEGYEYELFDGILPASLGAVDRILMEFHHNENRKIDSIVNKLKAAKFSVSFMNLAYQSEDSSASLQGVLYAVKTVDRMKVTFDGNTDDNLGIFYIPSNEQDRKVDLKIIDTFTGLAFHTKTLTVNNKCRYFLKHAYLLPNQSFRVHDHETGDLLLEKIINTDLEWDSSSFNEMNRNLAWIIPEEQRCLSDLGFSYLEIFHRKTYALKGCKIKKDDVVFDLGANCGVFSRYAFQRGAKKVYSFEPNKSLRACYENINRGNDYVLTNKAIYSKPVSFKDDPAAYLGAEIIEYDPTLGDASINLETFIKEQDIKKIDYLKVDIEGAEYDLFDNLSDETLRECVKTAVIEYHGNTGQEVKAITDKLTRCGFTWEFEYSDGDKFPLGMLYAIKQ